MPLKIIVAPLVNTMNMYGIDVPKLADMLVSKGFDGLHGHMDSPYCKFTPEQQNFFYQTDTDRYLEQYKSYCVEFAKRKLIFYTTNFCQYGDRSNKMGQFSYNIPFPQGKIKPLFLYDSWDKRQTSYWLKWTPQDADPTSVYTLVDPFGVPLFNYLNDMAKIDAQVQKQYPIKQHRIICMYNEEYSSLGPVRVKNAAGKMVFPVIDHRGGEGKIKKWYMEQVLQKNGIRLRKKFRLAVNFETYLAPTHAGGASNYHWEQGLKNYKSLSTEFGPNTLWEVHNVGPKEVKLLLDHGVDPAKVVFHTDARPEPDSEVPETIKMLKSYNTILALKYGVVGNVSINTLKDSNKFHRVVLPKLEQLRDLGMK